jgi:pyridoxine 4-dehydrogenase
VQLSLLAPEPLDPGGVAEVCRELGIRLIAYSPLALGLLARSGEAAAPEAGLVGPRQLLARRLQPALVPLRQAMAAIARPHGASLAAVALNWCRAHGAMPIPGLRTPQQVDGVGAALGWRLTESERLELDRLARASALRMPANPFQSA